MNASGDCCSIGVSVSYMLLIVEPQGQRADRSLEDGQLLYQRMVDYSRKLGAASLAPDGIRDPERVMREYGAPHLIHDVERTARG